VLGAPLAAVPQPVLCGISEETQEHRDLVTIMLPEVHFWA